MENLLFPLKALKSPEELLFEQSPLGQLHAQIPFAKLAEPFYKRKPPKHSGGRPPHLSIEGGLALMFLKHHLGHSDEMLIARLNSDVYMQLFCFTRISLHSPIRDKDLAGRWRRFVALYLDIEQLQKTLARFWSGKLEHLHLQLDDATCYESYIKYPTDVKLLLDCCHWLERELCCACSHCGLTLPRMDKYRKALKRASAYQKMKKKRRKKEKRLRRSLLHWLGRWQAELQGILDSRPAYHERLGKAFYGRLKTVRAIAAQQGYMLAHNVRRVPRRIVSLHKPYVRPIIRGKENKPYEFGAKAHITQVGGLNFIEHLSFEAFHEGNRMWQSIARNQKRFGKRCAQYGGDRIYANNANRTKANKRSLQTCFAPKGRRAKDEAQRKQARAAIANARATRLEGSFGTEKEHYGLRKVKARTELTEVAWIFFGIHTANAVRLSRKLAKKARPPGARAA